MPIDKTLLQDYFSGKIKHAFYEQTKEMAEAFLPHSDGIYPAKLIDDRRPNEPLEVKEYRKLVWKAKTKPTFGRILSSLSKIRRSSDWSINYPKDEFESIVAGERLDEYCEENFPQFKSVTNWAFSLLLKKMLVDPNAVCIVIPINLGAEETEYLEPYPTLFDSANVLDYAYEDYVLVNNPLGSSFRDGNNKIRVGKSFYYVDEIVIEKWDQINTKGDIAQTYEYSHGLGEVPFFKLSGVAVDSTENVTLHASRIEDILPELDEAVREYSDLQAGKVLNMYPERWEYVQNECPECRGMGRVHNPLWSETNNQPAQMPCTAPNCHNGYVATGPYSKILVRPTNAAMEGGGGIPTPPAGYVEKDIQILNLMTDSVRMHIYDALAAINFQFLEQSPLNQSGVAKEVDKDELNNTVHAIAEDLVAALDSLYRVITIYRYGTLLGEKCIDLLPTIPVPERFDLLSVNYLSEELDKSKKAGLNPSILNALELEYASKKFNSDHSVKDMLELVLGLDPLSNITEDDKISRLSNKGVKQTDYIISSNITNFVRRALEVDDKFPQKSPAEQRVVLDTMAAEIVASTASVILSEEDMNGPEESQQDLDIIGKIPLAVQQLSLAATRASDAGNTQLAATITAKINQLLGQVVETVEEVDGV